jgi:cytochrome c5
MKKMYSFLAVTMVFLIFTSSVLSPEKPADKKSTTPLVTTPIPDDLNMVFKNSCMGCHATGGSHMAMSMLDFSKWANYKPGKQAKKAAAICKMITKGAMPPKSFRESHPDAIPTETQRNMICKWSETLAPKK